MLTFSQAKLATFLICQRRFQLRYLRRLPWPEQPADDGLAASLERGRQFHRLLERRFLGLNEAESGDSVLAVDPTLQEWLRAFERHPPPLPDGRFLPEIALTVPVGGHLLRGRFDLLVLGDDAGHIFDWKTGRRPSSSDLGDDWQTRLYPALLVEGASALGAALSPDRVALTYWYAAAPDEPITISYSAAQHEASWAEIRSLVEQIGRLDQAGVWPLTDDLSHCRVCAYQVVCGRQAAGQARLAPAPDDELDEKTAVPLEPDLPG